MFLTYRYLLKPTRQQHAALGLILDIQHRLYNEALAERKEVYEKTGVSLTLFDQYKRLTQKRALETDLKSIALKLSRATLARLDRAFRGFFRRVKSKEKPGYPRFKGENGFTSFGFGEFCSIRFRNGHLQFKGMPGDLEVNLHRPIPEGARFCACTFKRSGKRWFVYFQLEVPAPDQVEVRTRVGIDVGINHLAMLSTGESIKNIRPVQKCERELRRRNRALARCQKGSRRRGKVRARLSRHHEKTCNTRRTYLHQQSAVLVRRFNLIAVEALNMKGLVTGTLAKQVHDASWSTFRQMLTYKASRAGGQVVAVDPRYTSQNCSGCGKLAPKSRSERTHKCDACDLILDRDLNAARNILHKAVVGLGGHNVGQGAERALEIVI